MSNPVDHIRHLQQERSLDARGIEANRHTAPETPGIGIRIGDVPDAQAGLELGSREVVGERIPRGPARGGGRETLRRMDERESDIDAAIARVFTAPRPAPDQ